MVHLQPQTTVFAYFSSADSNSIINSQVIKVTRIRIFDVKVTESEAHSVPRPHADLPLAHSAVGVGVRVVDGRKCSTFRAEHGVATSVTLLRPGVVEQQEQEEQRHGEGGGAVARAGAGPGGGGPCTLR